MIEWFMHGDCSQWIADGPSANFVEGATRRRPLQIHYWRREDLPHAWAYYTANPQPQTPPYAFRAWSGKGRKGTPEIHLLVDGTETRDSVLWLLLHELVHHELRGSSFLATGLNQEPRTGAYLHSDAAHQALPEERICDYIATHLYRSLGRPAPYRQDRLWWRRRVPA